MHWFQYDSRDTSNDVLEGISIGPLSFLRRFHSAATLTILTAAVLPACLGSDERAPLDESQTSPAMAVSDSESDAYCGKSCSQAVTGKSATAFIGEGAPVKVADDLSAGTFEALVPMG